jgi:mRNA interferase HigB
MGAWYIVGDMRIIARRTLREFVDSLAGHADQKAVKTATDAWYAITKGSAWTQPADVKAAFGTASILKDNRAVFNLCGNKYRLVVKINYVKAIVYIRLLAATRTTTPSTLERYET